MKKLLYRSSLALVLGVVFCAGCKAKKVATDTSEVISEENNSEKIEQQIQVIPAPGSINQQELDSIKNARTLEKTHPKSNNKK